MHAVQTPQNCAQLSRRPASRLGSPGGRCKGRIDRINLADARLVRYACQILVNARDLNQMTHIDGEIYRPVSYCITNLLDDTICAYRMAHEHLTVQIE